jgi:hypothetical protein
MVRFSNLQNHAVTYRYLPLVELPKQVGWLPWRSAFYDTLDDCK